MVIMPYSHSRHDYRAAAYVAVILLLTAVTAGRVAAQNPAPAPVGERDGMRAIDLVARREIAAVNEAMTSAFNRGDYLAAARFYTDDARIIGQGGVLVVGRQAVDRYWTSIPPGGKWKLEILDAGGGPTSPWQLGRSTLVMPSRSGDGTTHTSIVDFVAIYRRQPDRSLKLYIDMYVPSSAPAASK